MGGIRKIRFLSLLITTALLVGNAGALPVGDKELHDSLTDVEFSFPEIGTAEVDCEVYKYGTEPYEDKYVYSYQISNIDASIGLSFFSVVILDGASAFDADYDESLSNVVLPDLWAVVGSPAQSVDGLFGSPIYSDGTSTVLWFVSDYEPTSGKGTLFGTASGVPHSATGDLLTPIPEPATIVLLGICGWLTLIRKRQRV
jgi:hypothetical protein